MRRSVRLKGRRMRKRKKLLRGKGKSKKRS
jgi:hypothetical protein